MSNDKGMVVLVGSRKTEVNEIEYNGKKFKLDWLGVIDEPGHYFGIVESQGVVYNCDRPEGIAHLTKAIKAKFYLDGSTEAYEGYTFLENWNGWACPHFTLEVAKKLAQDQEGSYLEKEDAFDLNEGPDSYYEGIEIETEDGKLKVYAIGHSAWTWDYWDEIKTEEEVEEVEKPRSVAGSMNKERLSGFDSEDSIGTKFTTDLISEELTDHSHVYNIEFTIKPKEMEKPVTYELNFRSYTDAQKVMDALSTSL